MNRHNLKKNIGLPLISFIAVGGLYLLYFALYGFYPFGGRSVAWCDLEQQYVPLLMELRGIIRDGGSLLLGKGGGGMNLWGVFLFFVSSPVSFLSVLAGDKDMIYFINILTVFKLAMCGAAVSFYFQSCFKKLNPVFNVILSTMYAFSGYVMMYYQNNMWLDMMIIFPLLMLSMFRLSEKGKWGFYTICLSLSVVMNFYISYMLVIFIMISFGLMLVLCCEKSARGRNALRFFAADICAALITAVVWIPSMSQFGSSGRGESSLSAFGSGEIFQHSGDKAALLSCTSIITASLIIMYAKCKQFGSGKAKFFRIMTAMLLIGAFISPINKLWHTGSYQAYPLRYGFIIILLGLSVSAELLSEHKAAKLKDAEKQKKSAVIILSVMLLTAVVMGIAIYNSGKLNSYTSTLWTSDSDAYVFILLGLVTAADYFVFITAYRRGRIGRRLAAFSLTVTVAFESLFSFSVYFKNINDVTDRFDMTAELSGKIQDDDFYRLKTTKRYFYSNMLEGLGYSSIGHYTSLTDRDFLYTAKRLGYSSYWLDSSSNGGTLVTDTFLMNKYIVGMNGDMNGYCTPYETNGDMKIYRNNLICGGAVIADAPPEELLNGDDKNRIESSASIAEKLYGAKNIFTEIEASYTENLKITESDGRKKYTAIDPDSSERPCIKYKFYADGKKELYFDIFGNYSTSVSEPYFGAVDVRVDNSAAGSQYPGKNASGILDLGTFENRNVIVTVYINKDFEADNVGLYQMDAEAFAEKIKTADTADIVLDGNKIQLNSDSARGGWVYIPFAYNKGWSAELNGNDAEICRALGAFMAVKLDGGENKLVLTFRPTGFVLGAVVSALGAAVFLLLVAIGRRSGINLKKAESISEKLVFILSITAFAVVYIVSVVIWIVI